MKPADEHQKIAVEIGGRMESGAQKYGSAVHQVSPNLVSCAVAESTERPILHEDMEATEAD